MKILTEVTAPARLESLAEIIGRVMESASQWGFDGEGLFSVELVTEEAVVNVFSYAYPEQNGQIRVRCMEDSGLFVIEVTDWGTAFDVTTLPDTDISSPLEKRPVGGLGVHFMRKMTDSMRYRREDGQNILSLFFKREGAAV